MILTILNITLFILFILCLIFQIQYVTNINYYNFLSNSKLEMYNMISQSYIFGYIVYCIIYLILSIFF